jgi:hypothetical protein
LPIHQSSTGDQLLVFPHYLALLTLTAVVAVTGPAPAAQPTPEPGGANQAHGVAGSLHVTLFNGQTRVRKMALGKPDGSQNENYSDTADTKWLAFRSLMSNGTSQVLTMTQFSASIVDGDGISLAAQPDKVLPIGAVTGVPPGGAWKETVLFNVPADFKPVKIVLVPSNPHYKAFRITLAPADLP